MGEGKHTPEDWRAFNEAQRLERVREAAPELLEVARELKELFRFALLSMTPDIAKDGMEFIRKAEAAIAKATGEQSS